MKNAVQFLVLLLFLFTKSTLSQWAATNGPNTGPVSCMAYDSFGIYCGSDGIIFRSSDEGVSWTPNGEGIPFHQYSIVSNDTVMFAGTVSGVFKSINHGVSWTPVLINLPYPHILSVALYANYVYAGSEGSCIYKSSNSGVNWVNIWNGFQNYNILSMEVIGTKVLAGSGNGIYISTDLGENWTLEGAQGHMVNSLAVNNSEIIAGAGGRVFKSLDSGYTWNEVVNFGIPVRTVTAKNNFIYAGTEAGFNHTGGVFVSSNDGVSWSLDTNNLSSWNINCLLSSGSKIYAGSSYGLDMSTNNGSYWNKIGIPCEMAFSFASAGNHLFTATMHRVYSTTDEGLNWINVGNGVAGLESRSLLDVDSLIFQGSWGYGITMTTDFGITWIEVNNNLPNIADVSCFAAVKHQRINIIYTGINNAVYRTKNNGVNWENVGTFNTYQVSSLSIDGSNILAATFTGIYLTTNEGMNWSTVNNGLTDLWVYTLIRSQDRIFAGTAAGVFTSTNDGANWNAANNGIGSQQVFALAENNGVIFAGTESGFYTTFNNGISWIEQNDGMPLQYGVQSIGITKGYIYVNIFEGNSSTGIWKRPLSQVTGIRITDRKIPRDYSLSQNYPNPFNSQTKIKFSLPEQSYVRLLIYNILGSKIGEIVNKQIPAGNNEIIYDAGNLPSGVYFYYLEVNNVKIAARKMVLLK